MPSGGYRPGAGRKTDEEVQQQLTNRRILLALAAEEHPEWNGMSQAEVLWRSTFKRAIEGDMMAVSLIVPYIAGAKPKEPAFTINDNRDQRTQTLIWGPAYNDDWHPPALPEPQDPETQP